MRFSDAEIVLYDSVALTIEDSDAESERRFVSIGQGATGAILTVVYTYRGEEIRLISARPATIKERRAYEEGI